ncbi:MAG: S-methyl-5'-thioadenosine phosphorylase [Verrucomicrobiota bacterium]|jgi:5'-methylthioadenosine phosphorylase|nr:S-methyl-5'-thioadenosine phosphorylase [Verrucomicrobiota bacterium]HCF96270.1 S-methyl-5'-thioadenosine phosphorylase [Verrucomicrobiota bacterium]
MRLGIIGGTGLYQITGESKDSWTTLSTPFGAPSDQLLITSIHGQETVFLPRHGRKHNILPMEINHRANIWAMKSLGVEAIVSFSAVGSLQLKYKPRDFVIVDQYFDRTKKGREHTFFGDGIVAHLMFADPACPDLHAVVLDAARNAGVNTHPAGTYVNIEGPTFSTRAESRFYHHSGFDVIGMTNLAEARLCREAEICYTTCAMVTDFDSWHDTEDAVTVEMIVGNLAANSEAARKIVGNIATAIQGGALPPSCACRKALDQAILTAKTDFPTEAQTRLEPILRRYMQES